MDLTAEQRAVVEHEGGRTVVRGDPGTGKTATLVRRYLRLVERLPASRLLVVSGSGSAARRFTDAVLPHLRGGFDALPVTSPHGLAYDLVARSGRPPHLLSRAEQLSLIRRLLRAESPGDWPTLGPLLPRAGFAAEVATALAHLRLADVDAGGGGGGSWQELLPFARRYLRTLDEAGQLDAPGLLAAASDLAPSHRHRFDHVLVDDAEALGALELRLLSALTGDDLDVTVAIGTWSDAAHPLPGLGGPNAVAGRRGPNAVAGLRGPNAVAEPLVAGADLEIQLGRRFRTSPPGSLVRCNHPSVEPEAIAGELLAAHRGGVPWSAMAVVVRQVGARGHAIARALARHSIPVCAPGPSSAAVHAVPSGMQEPVVRALIDLLRWVDGDGSALDRLIVSPLAGVDPLEARSIRRAVLTGEAPLEDHPRLSHLVAVRDHLRRRQLEGDGPAELAYEAWAAGLTGIESWSSGEPALGAVDDRALDAVVAFVDGLGRHGDRHPHASLAETLAAVDGEDPDGDGFEPDLWRTSASIGTEGVTITSVSAATGREWHTVVVAGCVEGELPRLRLRVPLFDPAPLAGPRAPNAMAGLRGLAGVAGPTDLADEVRLFQTATSRATHNLVATAAPQPGVLLSRYVEDWPERAPELPLAPGQFPSARAPTAGTTAAFADGRLVLSASQLDTYDDCPLRYSFQYVLRARDEPTVHTTLGTLVHQVLAEFLDPANPQPPPRTREGLLAVAERHWRDDVARYRPQVEEVRRDFLAMLNSWWELEGSQEELAPEVLAVERRFDIEVGPHRLTGSIDRIDRADDGVGIRIIDYKTGKSEPSAAAVTDNLQLAVYHLAASRDPELAALGPPAQLQLRYLRTGRPLPQPITPDHVATTEARVLAMAERILAEDFAPAVDANCRNCHFHRLCPLQREGRQTRA